MPTLIELNNPDLTYCKRHELHCPCPKCKEPTLGCYPKIITEMNDLPECRGCKRPKNEDIINDDIIKCAALEYKEEIRNTKNRNI